MDMEELEKGYRVERILGEGGYARVSLALCKASGEKVAIKSFTKEGQDEEHLSRIDFEVKLMKALKHPNIVRYLASHETGAHIHLVMQYCSGGELLQYLIKNGRMPEADAKRIFRQICSAVKFAHDSGFIHRDLKLDNIFLDDHCNAFVGDWGLAGKWRKGHYHTHVYGTCNFASPEMVREQDYIGPEVDAWSLGIILHALVTGSLPFNGKDDDDYAKLIARGTFTLPAFLSQECKSVIRCLLATNSKDRSSVADVLNHPFLRLTESDPVSIHMHHEHKRDSSSSPPVSCGLFFKNLFHHHHHHHDNNNHHSSNHHENKLRSGEQNVVIA